MSPEIQNEIFQLMGKEILHQVLELIKKAPFLYEILLYKLLWPFSKIWNIHFYVMEFLQSQ